MDESGVNGREFLSSGTSNGKDNNSTSGNKSNSNSNSNSNSASTSNKQSSSTQALHLKTPIQQKGYGDAGGGNNNSKAPVQEIDDGLGSNAEEVANLWGQHQWSESDGSSIDLH